MAAARPIWTGSISFGLVNIPVKLFTAVREQRVSFHMLHDQDHVRLKRKLVCPAEDREVHPEHIVKGYEIDKDQYVVVRPDEIKSCAPKSTKAIEITDFVDLKEIDPVYYDRPYYVLPQPAATKPFRLLLEAMTDSQKIGVAKIVMHDKEYLAALRPVGDVIVLHTMHFGEEVVTANGLLPGDPPKVGDRELAIARQLVDSLSAKFDPDKYHDEYNVCLMKMIEKKAAGERIVTTPSREKEHARPGNLMAALEASLAKAKARGGDAPRAARARSHGRGAERKRKST
jgi:DNA end-binding protein Ku